MNLPVPVTWLRALAVAAAIGALPGFAAAQACPDYMSTPNQVLDLNAAQLAQPHRIDMVAGGNVDLGSCYDMPGYGYVVTGPDYHLNLSGTQPGTSIAVRVEAECDTILLANDYTGRWHYDDDSGSNWLDPELILPAADGTYDFWVGTWSEELCRATFSLQIAPTAALSPCPDPTLPPAQVLSFNAGQLSQEQRFDVVAGGDMQLMRCGLVDGYGTVVNYPDFALNLTAASGADLVIGLEGQNNCDTVLVVNDAGNNWYYNDDHEGLSSQIRLPRVGDGQYHIWAGTWGEELCHATLTLRATQGLTKPGLDGAAQGAIDDPGNLTGFRDQLGAILSFRLVGDVGGGVVWGSGPYTDDSSLAAAAVHAGVLSSGERGTVRVQITGPQAGFNGTIRNGVETRNYGRWDGSFIFVN